MTDLHDLKRMNDERAAELRGDNELIKKFGSKRPGLDDLCNRCGSRYGAHGYDERVCAYTYCRESKKDWQGRIKKYWVCWVQGTTINNFYRHFTLEGAEDEAERLAKLPDVKGKEVYIFECRGKCYAIPPVVAWVVTK